MLMRRWGKRRAPPARRPAPPSSNTPRPRCPLPTHLRPPAEGECEEVYGLEHVLALGSTEREWEMFTDGYDPESGER